MTYPHLTEEPGAIELAEQIKSGSLSPLEAVDAAIARIEAGDTEINAVVVRDFERARCTAKALDGKDIMPNQSLFGVPMTVKESFDVAGLPSCWGHVGFADQIASADSHVVTALKDAGAIILGKTNVPIDLADWQSFNAVYGRTGNPHDTSLSAGGSSGGSAAAVAAGFVPCEFGTDIGGSVRVPAHFNGIWGHKTSWGLVSKAGHSHPAFSDYGTHDGALSIAGPLARNADDLDLLVRLTSSLPVNSRSKPIKECRIFYLRDHPISRVDSSVGDPLDAAVETWDKAGLMVDTDGEGLPDLEGQHADYLKMLNIAMARGEPGPDGERASATDWFELLDRQSRCESAWAEFFDHYDFVLAAPAPILAFPHRDEAVFKGDVSINGEQRPAAEGLAWAGLASFPNLPSTVLPVGETGGLPCGVQVMGPHWRDLDCIAAAKALGQILHR
jgi:amidase